MSDKTRNLNLGGKRSGSGRKATKIDLTDLERLCSIQCTDQELASFFEVDVRTIERRKNKPSFAGASPAPQPTRSGAEGPGLRQACRKAARMRRLPKSPPIGQDLAIAHVI